MATLNLTNLEATVFAQAASCGIEDLIEMEVLSGAEKAAYRRAKEKVWEYVRSTTAHPVKP